jgi:hypothetical protein
MFSLARKLTNLRRCLQTKNLEKFEGEFEKDEGVEM